MSPLKSTDGVPRSILPALSSCIELLSSGRFPRWCRDGYPSGLPSEKSRMRKCFASCVQVVPVTSEHTAFRGTSISFFLLWHLAKVLIRKSAIRACSGASTLKDQHLGQVPGGRKKKEGKKKGRNPFWSREREVQECQENRRESCPVAETHGIRRWKTHPLFHIVTPSEEKPLVRDQARKKTPMNALRMRKDSNRLREVLTGVHMHGSEMKR